MGVWPVQKAPVYLRSAMVVVAGGASETTQDNSVLLSLWTCIFIINACFIRPNSTEPKMVHAPMHTGPFLQRTHGGMNGDPVDRAVQKATILCASLSGAQSDEQRSHVLISLVQHVDATEVNEHCLHAHLPTLSIDRSIVRAVPLSICIRIPRPHIELAARRVSLRCLST
jgi:hypothetical protein